MKNMLSLSPVAVSHNTSTTAKSLRPTRDNTQQL